MAKISSRGPKVSEAIGRQESFQTYGALRGERVSHLSRWESGHLAGPDLEAFNDQCHKITYVVYSYATPIAWVADGKVHKVAQNFSRTTSVHQGKLYRLEAEPA